MKFKRTERIGAIVKILSDNPNKIYTLSFFTEKFNAAKSTISEDIVIIREVLSKLDMGEIETISGAAGGIRFVSTIGNNRAKKFAMELCDLLKDDERVIAGNFIYMTDLMCNPTIIGKAGVILSSCFKNMDIDYVRNKGYSISL